MQVSECLFLSFWNYIFEDAVSRGLPSGQDLLPCFFLSNVLEQGITPTDYHAKERRLANTYLAEALSRRGTRPWEHRGESEANLPCRAGAQVAHSSPPSPPPPRGMGAVSLRGCGLEAPGLAGRAWSRHFLGLFA